MLLTLDPYRHRAIAFFLVVPLALAVMSATTGGYMREMGLAATLAYLSLLSLIPWWIGEGTTRLVWWCTRRHQPPLWLLCTAGALLAGVVVGPYVAVVTALFAAHWPGAEQLANRNPTDPLIQNLVPMIRAVVFWTAANYLFDRLLDYPRFRYEDATERRIAGALTGLQARLNKVGSVAEILVVKAEEHYISVQSKDARELIAYRFGRAVADLSDEDGFQVHRSYWVRRTGIHRVEDSDSRITLEMQDGTTVSVSRRYHALVRQVV